MYREVIFELLGINRRKNSSLRTLLFQTGFSYSEPEIVVYRLEMMSSFKLQITIFLTKAGFSDRFVHHPIYSATWHSLRSVPIEATTFVDSLM